MVLLYHRIADVKSDPRMICVKPDNFEAHIKYLKENYRPMRLTELSDAIKEKKIPHRAVVITFDDGYADNFTIAKPILEKYHVPATVFVATDMITNNHDFWWDEIEYIKQEKGEKEYMEIHDKIKQCSIREQASLVTQYGRKVDDNDHRPLTQEQLRALESGGLIEVGSHTVFHTQLASQTLEDQEIEIFGSKDRLESAFKHKIPAFSYPFGEPHKDYTINTVNIVKALGYECAVANHPRTVTRYTDPYQMPRFIVRDWDIPTFKENLKEWYYE
jgi:peptidoglycan/xylan/chitin deacetylase (PgdA/CDA1 family)